MNADSKKANSHQTLDCRDAELVIGPMIDGELAADDQALLEAHLTSCDACRTSLAQVSSVKSALRLAARADRAPDRLVEALRAQLRATPPPPRKTSKALVAGTAVAAATLAAAFTFAALQHQHDVAQAAKPVDALVRSAVAHHALELPVDVASGDAAVVGAFLEPRVGAHIEVPRLDGQGFSLQGARVVYVEGKRAAQVAYAGPLGQRVSLLAVPDAAGTFSAAGGAPVVRDVVVVQPVSHDGVMFAVTGALEPARMAALAASIANPR